MATKKESIGKKVKELQEILAFFESEEIDLDEGIKKYEKAMKLAKEVEKTLKGYQEKIKEVTLKYEDAGEEESEDAEPQNEGDQDKESEDSQDTLPF